VSKDKPATSRIPVDDWRPRIEHAQIMQVDDLLRTGRLGGKSNDVFPVFLVRLNKYISSYTKRPAHSRVSISYIRMLQSAYTPITRI
jgi:predicted amidohydrolase YtcJ